VSDPVPNQRTIVIGRLVAAPAVRTTASGTRVGTLRINVMGIEERVLVAFGPTLVGRLDGLTAGRLIYAEGRWQARQGAPPELIVDTLTPLLACNSQGQPD
jgi:hypothetical protein